MDWSQRNKGSPRWGRLGVPFLLEGGKHELRQRRLAELADGVREVDAVDGDLFGLPEGLRLRRPQAPTASPVCCTVAVILLFWPRDVFRLWPPSLLSTLQ
jgi:hypothetical protein